MRYLGCATHIEWLWLLYCWRLLMQIGLIRFRTYLTYTWNIFCNKWLFHCFVVIYKLESFFFCFTFKQFFFSLILWWFWTIAFLTDDKSFSTFSTIYMCNLLLYTIVLFQYSLNGNFSLCTNTTLHSKTESKAQKKTH